MKLNKNRQPKKLYKVLRNLFHIGPARMKGKRRMRMKRKRRMRKKEGMTNWKQKEEKGKKGIN